jgi:hypothetical protein
MYQYDDANIGPPFREMQIFFFKKEKTVCRRAPGKRMAGPQRLQHLG